jgi:hypothetical protein
MKLKIAPDSQAHVFELAVLAALGAGLTVIATNLAGLNLGAWSAIVSAGLTIAMSLIKNIENS